MDDEICRHKRPCERSFMEQDEGAFYEDLAYQRQYGNSSVQPKLKNEENK